MQIKLGKTSETELVKNKENDLAFVFMTFFLEFIILIGVGFHGYFTIGSYVEMKKLVITKSQIETRYKLLNIIYNNRKVKDTIPLEKDINVLIKLNKVNITPEEVEEFYDFLEATNIVLDNKINLTYNKAVKEIEKLLIV